MYKRKGLPRNRKSELKPTGSVEDLFKKKPKPESDIDISGFKLKDGGNRLLKIIQGKYPDYDPIMFLAMVANNDVTDENGDRIDVTLSTQIAVAEKLANFIYAKKRADIVKEPKTEEDKPKITIKMVNYGDAK